MNANEEQKAQDLAIARQMGEDFARARGEEILKQFLCETKLVDELYDAYLINKSDDRTDAIEPKRFLDHVTKDYIEPFTRVLSAAYTIGQLDAREEINATIYRPRKKPLTKGPSPSQLFLPGMDE